MSSFGDHLKVHLLGESHGQLVGVLLEGLPAGVPVDAKAIQAQLERRRPAQSAVTSQRRERDPLTISTGVHEGRTSGAPLLMTTTNTDVDSSVYSALKPRPGHSDLGGHLKFFGHADPRGAGHFGGRLTWGLVAAGALARQALDVFGIRIVAYTERIGAHHITQEPSFDDAVRLVDSNEVRCPDDALAQRMRKDILDARKGGDSLGGAVRCRIQGLPAGLGGYHARSFESRMSLMLFGIPAVKAVGFGLGHELATMTGSQANDPIGLVQGAPQALTNRQGGVVGGLTDGSEVSLLATFKPTASILTPQDTVDLESNAPAKLTIKGRHDPCIVPRAVPVVENAVALVLLDLLLERLGEEGFQRRLLG
jgi:chorismate synthase